MAIPIIIAFLDTLNIDSELLHHFLIAQQIAHKSWDEGAFEDLNRQFSLLIKIQGLGCSENGRQSFKEHIFIPVFTHCRTIASFYRFLGDPNNKYPYGQ